MSRAPLLWCLVAAALFGASTPAAKALLDDMGPLTLAALFYLGAGLFSAPFARRGGRASTRWSRRNVGLLAGAIIAGGVAGPIAMLYGIRLAPAATTALWLNLETPATALLGAIFFREHLQRRGWLAVAIVCGASVMLASPERFGLAPAALLFTVACLCWGLDNNLTALIDGFTPSQSTLAKGLVAGSVSLVLAFVVGEPMPSWPLIGGALVVGMLAYGASLILYVSAAQHMGATRSQMLFATAPFFGVAIAWLVLGEEVTPVEALAAVLMAVGFWLGASDVHAHGHIHEATRHTHWHRHDDQHHGHEHAGVPLLGWHVHEHMHEALEHEHAHRPDLHHRHVHSPAKAETPV